MKTFYIFETSGDGGDGSQLLNREVIQGTLVDARRTIAGDDYQAGMYRILEDTSGIITKSVESTPKVKISFESSRKRGPRQPKAEGATEPKAKKAKAGK